MQILQVIARETCENFVSLLKEKERSLRGTSTTFSVEKKQRNVWKHERYPGKIFINTLNKKIVSFEIKTRPEGQEWQITHAFVGYLNRHFSSEIAQISIYFMNPQNA
jgi:hypothetical protein